MNDFLSMPAVVARKAAAQPEKTAVIEAGRSLSYRSLWQAVRGVACALAERGLDKGECVLLQGTNTPEFVAALYGIQLAGGIAVITARKPSAESLAQLKADTDARFFLGDAVDMTDIESLPFDSLWALPDNGRDFAFPTEHQPVDMIFTTGTTGKAKGVLHPASVAAAGAENLVLGAQYTPDTVYLIYAPMNHVFGLRKVDAVLFAGGTIVFCDGMINIKKFFAAFEEHGANALHLLPSAARALFALTKDRLGRYAEQIRFVESGAEPFPEADKERVARLLPHSRLYFGYGSSEADNMTKYSYLDHPGLAGCVGAPMKHALLRFVNENGETHAATAEDPGFVVCGGPTVMLGYWREPELTASVLKDGWLYTSDLGYLDEHGFLRLLGRAGDVINVGGIKVSCSELEDLILRMEGVKEAACIPMEDKMSGQAPKLFVVMEEGTEFSKEAVKAFLARHLEHYKLPRQIVSIAALPRAANGKVLKRELEEKQTVLT